MVIEEKQTAECDRIMCFQSVLETLGHPMCFWSLCHLFLCSTTTKKKRSSFHLEFLHPFVGKGIANPKDPMQTICALTVKYLDVEINWGVLLMFLKWA